jgi:hypothetical protein
MQILSLDRFRGERSDLVARESALGGTVLLAVLVALGLAWVLVPLPSAWLRLALGVVGLPCVLLSSLMLPGLARVWRRDHWVVRARREGIAINARSALNSDLPADEPTVAWIEAGELDGVRRVEELRSVPDSDGGTEQRRHVWLELVLAGGDTSELADVLERERSRRGRGRTHFHAYPVEVVDQRRLRVAWQSGNVRLRPALEGFLRTLSLQVPLLEPVAAPEVDWRSIPDGELDDYARSLVAAGRRLDAIRLLRTRRGWELTRARAHVEQLDRRAQAA